MDHFNVNLLNAVGITKVRNANFDIRRASHFAAVFTGQGDHFHPLLTRRCDRFDHVCRVTGGGDPQQYIAFATYRFNVTRENIIETKIVTDAGNMTNVRNGNRRVARTVFTVATGQLFGKVHGVAMGAAVATGKHFATGFKAVC